MRKFLLASVAVAAFSVSPALVNAQQSGPGSTGSSPAPSAQQSAPGAGSNSPVPGPNTASAPAPKGAESGGAAHVGGAERSGTASAQSTAPQSTAPAPAGSAQQQPNDMRGRSSSAQGNGAAPQERDAQQRQQGTPQQSQTQRANPPETTGSVNTTNVNITTEQRTKVTRSFTNVNVRPVTNVTFSVSTGTVLPETVELHTLPADIITVVPAWRTYRYVLVGNQIVIIEPGTRKIVTIIERSA